MNRPPGSTSENGNAVRPEPNVSSRVFERYLVTKSADLEAVSRREWLGYGDLAAHGSALPTGETATVIENPLRPGEFRLDTKAARHRFLRQWCAWSSRGADAVARDALGKASAEFRERCERARRENVRCVEAIDENLGQARGGRLPRFPKSRVSGLAPFVSEPTIRAVRQVADLTAAYLDAWEAWCGPRENEVWPACLRQLLRATNSVRVYEVASRRRSLLVVVAFSSTIRYRMDWETLEPRVGWESASTEAVGLVRSVFREWRSRQKLRSDYVLFSIGAVAVDDAPKGEDRGSFGNGHGALSWTIGPEDGVRVVFPGGAAYGRDQRVFVERLLPIGAAERTARVKGVVDGLREEGHGGSITIDEVRGRMPWVFATSGGEERGWPRRWVLEGFLALQDAEPGAYRIEKGRPADRLARGGVVLGRVRVVEEAADSGVVVTRGSGEPGWLRRHGLGLLTLALTGGAALWLGQWKEELELTAFQSWLFWIPLAYFGNLFVEWMRRNVDRARD